MARFVIAGMTRLSMTAPVDGFPLEFSAYRTPPWMRCAVVGGAYNVGGALRSLGDTPRLCTLVGSDVSGAVIRAALRRSGLDGRGVVTTAESATTMILVGPEGRAARTAWSSSGAADYPMERFIERAVGADMAVISSRPFGRPFLRTAKHLLHLPVAVDLHTGSDRALRRWMEAADVLFRSHEGLSCPPRQWVGEVLGRHRGIRVAAVGCGADGCVMGLRDGRLVEVAAVAPRGVRSTDGAGDSLLAAFLHGWLAGGDPVDALASAVVFAGWKVGAQAGGEGFLTADELAALRQVSGVRPRISSWRQAA